MAGLTLVSRAGLLAAPASSGMCLPPSLPEGTVCASSAHLQLTGDRLASLACVISQAACYCPVHACMAALSQMCHRHTHAVAPADTSKPLGGGRVTAPKPFPQWGRSSTPWARGDQHIEVIYNPARRNQSQGEMFGGLLGALDTDVTQGWMLEPGSAPWTRELNSALETGTIPCLCTC